MSTRDSWESQEEKKDLETRVQIERLLMCYDHSISVCCSHSLDPAQIIYSRLKQSCVGSARIQSIPLLKIERVLYRVKTRESWDSQEDKKTFEAQLALERLLRSYDPEISVWFWIIVSVAVLSLFFLLECSDSLWRFRVCVEVSVS